MDPWIEAGNVPDSERFAKVDLDEICAAASEILYSLSGWQYGIGTVKVRPARLNPQCECGLRTSIVGLGSTGPTTYGFRGMDCVCTTDNAVKLRGRAPRDLTVRVDGAILDPSDYRLLGSRLFRVNGVWPCCQRLELDDTQEGTFSVGYTWGVAPPPSGRLAAKALVVQLALADSDDPDCRLPAGVREIVRTGVTQVIEDPTVLLKEGLTGIEIVDMFLVAANGPGGRRRPSRVFSPDVPNNFTEALP